MAPVPDDHERGLAARGVRKELGAYYTPPDVVDALLALALDPMLVARAAEGPGAVASLRVIDPACGTGNFLVAAARRIADVLVELGFSAPDAAAAAVRCVRGIEIDPRTATVCRANLRDLCTASTGRQIRRGDALLDPSLAPEGRFDLVVGNPPFLSQLGASTARDVAGGAALRERFGASVAGYTDPAALFMVLGHRLARPDGGVVAMIEPVSLLTARDASGARAAVLERARLTDLWVLGDGIFDASVEVCAPVVVRAGGVGPVRLHTGRDRARGALVDPPPTDGASWSSLLAEHGGLPRRTLQTAGTLGQLATATADFRDQYYGLAPHVHDAAETSDSSHPPLVTAGLIDPGSLTWGQRTTRFNKTAYLHPRVDLEALPPALQAWAADRLVPKVLLATQTRVLEAVVDEAGDLLPSVPVISVVAQPADLWRVAAVLTCPAVAVEAARRHLGSGRNARALRLRAREVLELPLPADRGRWDEAAALLRSGAPLEVAGRTMDEAYGLVGDDELLAWWTGLLPGAPRPISAAPPPAGPPAS